MCVIVLTVRVPYRFSSCIMAGRINTVELQTVSINVMMKHNVSNCLLQVLNIDLSHIQKAVGNIVNNDPSIELIQGELISGYGCGSKVSTWYNHINSTYSLYRDYKKTLSVQINEQLLQYGNVSLADLSTTFGLPLSYIIPVSY